MATRRTIGATLAGAAATWGDAPAIDFDGERISYADLYDRAGRFGAGLRSLGLSAGDPVLIMLPNAPEFLYAWLGAALIGAVTVPVNPDYRGEVLNHVVSNSGARAFVLDAEFLERFAAVANHLAAHPVVCLGTPTRGDLETVGFEQVLASQPPSELPDLHEHDMAAIMYTSGTTGPSKGARIAHRHAWTYAGAVRDLLELGEGDIYYAPLPLFHIAGQWAVVLACLQAGATAALKRRFSVSEFWQDIRTTGATTSFLLGAMANFLYREASESSDSDSPLDRVLMVPLISEVQDFRDRFGVKVCTCYGSTESNVPIVSDFQVADSTTAGKAAPGFELRLVDEQDNDVADGEVGELVVRPPEPWMTMAAYHGNPEGTAAALRNLWLHTGDAFRKDASGSYYFVDRLKDALRRRGENISSFEVEREVNAHHAVLESAAVGVPSRHTEDELLVVVVLKPGHTVSAEELREFLKPRVPRFMVPDHIVVADQLPKTPTGKIQKNLIREDYGKQGLVRAQGIGS